MSDGPKKPHLQEALERAGISQVEMCRLARISDSERIMVFNTRAKPETAGKVSRLLGERLGLSGKERKVIFSEVVNMPGRNDPLTDRVSTENPFDNIR